jgi:hypothetical protein
MDNVELILRILVMILVIVKYIDIKINYGAT